MNRDIGRFVAPFLALALLALVVTQTLHALQESGVWRIGARKAFVPPDDPLAALDGLVARAQQESFSGASRDPFGYGAVASRPEDGRPVVRRPFVPRPPALPVLTAIVFDADPRALVRWEGAEHLIRPGGHFAEFEVVSIAREEVVLKRGPEQVVLRRKPQGD
jgi:hypothetical protein